MHLFLFLRHLSAVNALFHDFGQNVKNNHFQSSFVVLVKIPVFALGVLQKSEFAFSLGFCREQKSHSRLARGAYFRRRALFLWQNKALLRRCFAEPEFSRFRIRGDEKMQNRHFRGVLQGSEIAFSCSVARLFLHFCSNLRMIWCFFCWRGDFFAYFVGFGAFWLHLGTQSS